MACALRGMSCSMLRCRTQALRVSVRGQHPRRPTRTKIGMQALVPLAETRCGRKRRVRKQSMELVLRPRPHPPDTPCLALRTADAQPSDVLPVRRRAHACGVRARPRCGSVDPSRVGAALRSARRAQAERAAAAPAAVAGRRRGARAAAHPGAGAARARPTAHQVALLRAGQEDPPRRAAHGRAREQLAAVAALRGPDAGLREAHRAHAAPAARRREAPVSLSHSSHSGTAARRREAPMSLSRSSQWHMALDG